MANEAGVSFILSKNLLPKLSPIFFITVCVRMYAHAHMSRQEDRGLGASLGYMFHETLSHEKKKEPEKDIVSIFSFVGLNRILYPVLITGPDC